MADRGSEGSSDHAADPRGLLLAIAEQRHRAATESVAVLVDAHPGESLDELRRRLIRQCARDLAVAGAMTGGAAAAPGAGPAGAAALLGAEGALNTARLGEMVMAIGILHGHTDAPRDDRALWLAAALGASEGTAVGLTGLAARAGVRGGARLMRRIPNAPSADGTGRFGRFANRVSAGSGPWGLAALVPYTLGASVGAAGNLALAVSVGRAATKYFTSDDMARVDTSRRAARDRGGRANRPSGEGDAPGEDDGVWEGEFLSERFLDED